MHRKGAAEQTPSIRLPRSIPLCDTRSFRLCEGFRGALEYPPRERIKRAPFASGEPNNSGGPGCRDQPAALTSARPWMKASLVFRHQGGTRARKPAFALPCRNEDRSRPAFAAEANQNSTTRIPSRLRPAAANIHMSPIARIAICRKWLRRRHRLHTQNPLGRDSIL
jgi:hypothetical protein